MKRKAGWFILVCSLVPVSLLTADSERTREVAQNKPADAASNKPQNKVEGLAAEKKAPEVAGEGRPRQKPKSKAGPGITPEREAAVKTFVDQHHPELAELLVHLKENNKKEYEKAVRDLFRTSERLARVHEEDVDRYELELKLWQSQSRIDLLAARFRMAPTSALRKQLKDAIVEQQALRKSQVELDRQRTTERLAKLDDQLKSLEKLSNKVVEEQLQALIGNVEVPKTEKGDNKVDKASGVRARTK